MSVSRSAEDGVSIIRRRRSSNKSEPGQPYLRPHSACIVCMRHCVMAAWQVEKLEQRVRSEGPSTVHPSASILHPAPCRAERRSGGG